MNIKDVKTDPYLASVGAFEIYSQCMYRADIEEYRQQIASFSAGENVYIFAAHNGSGYTGIIVLELQSSNSAEIVGIAVKKEFQRRGIGKFMIFQAAAALNLEYITAETDCDAVEFYRKSGFAVKEFIRRYPDAVVARYNCRLDILQNQKLPK